jgi:hypothetical protein
MIKTNAQALEYALTLHFAARKGLMTKQDAFESLITLVCAGRKNLSGTDVIDAADSPMVSGVIQVNDVEKQQAIINVTRRMVY